MKKLLNSNAAAWVAFLIVMAVIVFTFKLRTVWWAYFDIFFAFMMVFCHIIALSIYRYNKFASARLDTIALIMGVLTVLSLIGEWIAFYCLG